MRKLKYSNGDLVGNLCVVGFSKGKYHLRCSECSDDSELYGDGIFYAKADYLLKGKKPCGCSGSAKYSEDQWRVLIKRKCIENKCNFIDFIEGRYTDQDTKMLLECDVCSHKWDSCSVSNFMRDRNCPKCAYNKKGFDKRTEDSEWISRFISSNQFDPAVYSFTRTTPTARLWKVYCKICDNDFLSDRSNLVAGKVPCDCGKGGGYNKDKLGFFYLLKCKIGDKIFIKYGITNFIHRRFVSHRRVMKDAGGEILEYLVYEGDGKSVLKLESHLKRTIEFVKGLTMFRRETCSVDLLGTILEQVEELKLNKIHN